MKIALGSDHAGLSLKQVIMEHLVGAGHELSDFGTYTGDSADYPDYAHQVAVAVLGGSFDFGILICGTGLGVSISANRHRGIRAALCWVPEIARLARAHNDANVLALPGRFIDPGLAIEVTDTFLNTVFEGGRHARRVQKIEQCDAG